MRCSAAYPCSECTFASVPLLKGAPSYQAHGVPQSQPGGGLSACPSASLSHWQSPSPLSAAPLRQGDYTFLGIAIQRHHRAAVRRQEDRQDRRTRHRVHQCSRYPRSRQRNPRSLTRWSAKACWTSRDACVPERGGHCDKRLRRSEGPRDVLVIEFGTSSPSTPAS